MQISEDSIPYHRLNDSPQTQPNCNAEPPSRRRMTSEAETTTTPSSAFKLNAICEKLKPTSSDQEEDEDDMVSSNDHGLAYETLAAPDAGTGLEPPEASVNGKTKDHRNMQPGSYPSDTKIHRTLSDMPRGVEDDGGSEPEEEEEEEDDDDEDIMMSKVPSDQDTSEDQETAMEMDSEMYPVKESSSKSACLTPSGSRNKRKNFLPRNIVYQYADSDGENEMMDDYCYGEGGHDSSDPEPGSDDGMRQETPSPCDTDHSLTSLSDAPGHKVTADNSRAAESEQPLDLSDSGSTRRKSLLPRKSSEHSPMDLSSRRETGRSPVASRMFSFPPPAKDNASSGQFAERDTPNSTSSPVVSTATGRDGSPYTGSEILSPSNSPSPSPLDSATPLSLPKVTPEFPTTTADASTMKDYAESTMKELLGLYGLNDMVESITKNVPLQNFSSGRILESMAPYSQSCLASMAGFFHPSGAFTPTLHPYQPPSQHSTSLAPSSEVEQNSGRCSTPKTACSTSTTSTLNMNNNSLTTTTTTSAENACSTHVHQRHPLVPPMDSTASPIITQSTMAEEGLIDSLRSKVVDSMSTFSCIHPHGAGIIGSHRDMATTFLTLAALGTKVSQTASEGPSISTTLPSPAAPSMFVGPAVSAPSQSLMLTSANQSSMLVSSSSPLSQKHLDQAKSGPIDYSRYVKRFSSSSDCGSSQCRDLNYREHFHCLDCNSKVFVKKEEMIRHFKWHKKRDESLQHGFLRYSPMDDCSEKFPNCSHNRRQTHYHCLKEGCDKVYISTSDVQMHANYHRKDSAIIQEGFQRFRATEDCNTPSCSFYGQRTTHFHCRRYGCSYTFKNKADMEKHKSYHIKDEQLNKDGFKKFMKHEHCPFENCRFSRVCNHIHCIRPGCTYVLHSSGQLFSHKRKHERRENELAYRKFKLAQSMMKTLSESGLLPPGGAVLDQMSFNREGSNASSDSSMAHFTPNVCTSLNTMTSDTTATAMNVTTSSGPSSSLPQSFSKFATNLLSTGPGITHPNLVPSIGLPPQAEMQSLSLSRSGSSSGTVDVSEQLHPDDHWKKYLTRYNLNDHCKHSCEYQYKEHFHCHTDNCDIVFRAKDISGAREHARNHEQQDMITDSFYITVENGQESGCHTECPYYKAEKHFHCCWEGCREVISGSDKPFRRLDHYKIHEYSRKITPPQTPNLGFSSGIDAIFKRKRGRPPKNRIVEFPMHSSHSVIPQAIYTSFKLPKPIPVSQPGLSFSGTSVPGPFSSAAMNLTSPAVSAQTKSVSLLTPSNASTSLPVSSDGCAPSSVISSPTSLHQCDSRTSPMPTSVTSPVPVPLKTMSLPSPQVKPEAFSSFSHLKPHMSKHSGSPSPIPIYPPDFTSPPPSPRSSLSSGGVDREEGTMDEDEDGPGNEDVEMQENKDLEIKRSESRSPSDQCTPGPSAQPFCWQPLQLTTTSQPSVAGPLPLIADPRQTSSFHGHPVSSTASEVLYGSPQVDYSAGLNDASSRDDRFGSQKRICNSRPEECVEAKKIKIPSLRILKDEPVPVGYTRYRFNEDCGYVHCGYREHQTHFHCIRKDCGYSFCDKTRFVQHTARHERLDTLMGGDFQQYRANINCGRQDCLYANTLGTMANKASHFHCLKCSFVCTDTNKVVAHRRQHAKMDSINAAGFDKYTPSQNCNVEGCNHNQKQTHYHCLKCNYAVLGLSQMSSHKYRHMD